MADKTKKQEWFRMKESDYPALKAAKSKRDVMIHAAVTIMGQTSGIEILGVKDEEICQFAGHWNGPVLPIPEHHVRHAFKEMENACILRMRAYGLIR